jgi:hypothetical protein
MKEGTSLSQVVELSVAAIQARRSDEGFFALGAPGTAGCEKSWRISGVGIVPAAIDARNWFWCSQSQPHEGAS